tara:strand:- start:23 stop:607 length:585 start_codon:yes stop_codon:yes gene_type:complete
MVTAKEQDKMLQLVFLAVAMFVVWKMYTNNQKQTVSREAYSEVYPALSPAPFNPTSSKDTGPVNTGNTAPSATSGPFAPVSMVGNDKIELGNGCLDSSGQFLASNLLPKSNPKAGSWNEYAPQGPLKGQHLLLEPEKCIGADTISNHLRNASHDLRKEPMNPQKAVSPWINTTMGPDLNRRPLEDCAGKGMSAA